MVHPDAAFSYSTDKSTDDDFNNDLSPAIISSLSYQFSGNSSGPCFFQPDDSNDQMLLD